MKSKIKTIINNEARRQEDTLMLIPSENYASRAVRQACGSVMMNKYAEGYPGRRYYEGNEVVDELEVYVSDLVKEVFGVKEVNVQPYSGSPANSAVQMAVLNPKDKLMGLSLSGGGHLTHGHPKVTFSGTFFESVQYGVEEDGKIDYDKLMTLVKKEKPKLLIAGITAYPYVLDFKRFGEIADAVGAYLLADISHIAGLVVAGAHPSPVDDAHIITTTTHKTLRGPRGAMIMVTHKGWVKDMDLATKIDRAVFPGLQGGPHNNTTAAIGVALEETKREEFREYGDKVVKNAKVLAEYLRDEGIRVWGTENHLMLLDFSEFGGGAQVAYAMAQAGMVANKNTVPHDKYPPFYPSGVRIGTPAVTTRGLGEKEMKQIAVFIGEVVGYCSKWPLPEDKTERAVMMSGFKEAVRKEKMFEKISKKVRVMLKDYPLE